MTMIIDPTTEKGKTQIETIKWCEEQMNKVMVQFFNDKFRIQRGLRLEFKIPINGRMDESIKVDVLELAPETEERFEYAVKEAKKFLAFPQVEKTLIGIDKGKGDDKSVVAEITEKK